MHYFTNCEIVNKNSDNFVVIATVRTFLDRRAETRILSLRSAQSRSLEAAFSRFN